MPRFAFKPDDSFFRKIAIGAIGARAVSKDLALAGHQIVELERGSTETKLWKDVKRKRVRIPDLICLRCGVRVESRAKTRAEISMSHSFSDETRAWDFGMVNEDWIAFPICEAASEELWNTSRLVDQTSYWHERNWTSWKTKACINYFRVADLRREPHSRRATKGVTEGSETSIAWDATFSPSPAYVETILENRLTLRRAQDARKQTRSIRSEQTIRVAPGQHVAESQVLAASVAPLSRFDLRCSGSLESNHVSRLLISRERTQRFAGVKLARLLGLAEMSEAIRQIALDQEEDIYVRLEAAAYLAGVCGESISRHFGRHYQSPDQQTQLEAVIATGEITSPEAVETLAEILNTKDVPLFLRSAAAWCLGRIGSPEALKALVQAFADIDHTIREEALEGVVAIGRPATDDLLAGLLNSHDGIAAGCAESLRQQGALSDESLDELASHLLLTTHPRTWSVWLLGNLPRESVMSRIASVQKSAPDIHFALSILWSFSESWIARRWEKS